MMFHHEGVSSNDILKGVYMPMKNTCRKKYTFQQFATGPYNGKYFTKIT